MVDCLGRYDSIRESVGFFGVCDEPKEPGSPRFRVQPSAQVYSSVDILAGSTGRFNVVAERATIEEESDDTTETIICSVSTAFSNIATCSHQHFRALQRDHTGLERSRTTAVFTPLRSPLILVPNRRTFLASENAHINPLYLASLDRLRFGMYAQFKRELPTLAGLPVAEHIATLSSPRTQHQNFILASVLCCTSQIRRKKSNRRGVAGA